MRARRRHPAPIAATPRWCRGSSAGQLKPDFVIPFKLQQRGRRQGAERALRRAKSSCPRRFTNENHIQKIQGIYVPFWMFDGEAEGDAHYEATRSRTYTSGDYEITETGHFDVYRAGTSDF